MSAERDALIASLEQVNDALDSMARTLQESKSNTSVIIEKLDAGESLSGALGRLPEQIAKLTGDAKELEVARHRARASAFALGLSEGLSIGELGRLFGISRQLAQRFAKEAREVCS
jgi:hypothetical protein